MNQVYLLTGGNIGNRKKNLQAALTLIQKQIGTVLKSSKIYETDAWGIRDQASFYNQIHLIETKFSAKRILQKILKIEEEMGRIRTVKNAARIIDIDILFYNKEIIHQSNLEVPHPEIANRRFVLVPLNEIAPEMIHPVSKKNISELLRDCNDPLSVVPVFDEIE